MIKGRRRKATSPMNPSWHAPPRADSFSKPYKLLAGAALFISPASRGEPRRQSLFFSLIGLSSEGRQLQPLTPASGRQAGEKGWTPATLLVTAAVIGTSDG